MKLKRFARILEGIGNVGVLVTSFACFLMFFMEDTLLTDIKAYEAMIIAMALGVLNRDS